MASSSNPSNMGFIYPRTEAPLPDGTEWKDAIAKYNRRYALVLLKGGKMTDPQVAAHRFFYDRHNRVMENSLEAYNNGIQRGFFVQEGDCRIKTTNRVMHTGHDEVVDRVTTGKGRWDEKPIEVILDSSLVIRGITPSGDGYTLSYTETEGKVPLMDDLLGPNDGQTLQLDLRKEDLALGIAWLCRHPLELLKAMPKGYNFNYSSYEEIDTAAVAAGAPNNWAELISWTFVFHPDPLLAKVEKTFGTTAKDITREQYPAFFAHAYKIVSEQVFSMMEHTSPNTFVPEIGFSCLGLGYDKLTGMARNPLDGTPIEDPGVVREALFDRVLMEVAMEVQKRVPETKLGSCARLYDVATPDGRRYVTNLVTSKADEIPTGEKGISHKLRGIAGGLFPETQFCNADDPYREIAGRVWIEHAGLDRSQLLHMTYIDWIAQAGPEVVDVFDKLNGPFLPNVYVDQRS